MALLCGSCHDKVTRGIFSKDKIRDALRSPKCLENGYTSDVFDIGKSTPTVKIGNTVWEDVPIILQIEDIPILEIRRSRENKGTFEISALFCDDNGEEIFKITNNIWEGNITNWDIETIGQTITIRKNLRKIALEITIDPNNGIININKLHMNFRGATIFGDQKNGFYAKASDGSQICIGRGGGVKSCDVGVLVLKDSVAMGIISKITNRRSQ